MTQSPYTLLLVDDSEIIRASVAPFLEHAAYRVVEAKSGPEALLLIDEKPIDLVLLDINMPGMDGFEVLQQIRRCHSPENLPVIYMTARKESYDQLKGFDLGANDYVTKSDEMIQDERSGGESLTSLEAEGTVTKPLDMKVVLARIQAQLRGKTPLRDNPSHWRRTISTIDDVEPGTILDAKYRLDALIDRGAYGAVYRATHLSLERPVALKLLATTFRGEGNNTIERFQREGISTCRVQHPHAVSVLDFSITNGGLPFLVMELLNGHTLDKEFKRVGALDPKRCGEILVPVCEVLNETHSQGIIHRDIKPTNIFLHRGRQGEVVKVLDFGIARMTGEAAGRQRITHEGSIIGTPAYMAPERMAAGMPYDGRSDVFSVGIVLFESLTGRRPTTQGRGSYASLIDKEEDGPYKIPQPPPRTLPRVRSLRPEISPALDDLVARTLSGDVERRPTARQLADELAHEVGLTSLAMPSAPVPGKGEA